MQEGGCHPVDGCLDGDDFAGADFEFLAANVVSEQTGETLFPPYKVQRFEANTKVAFIGMTLEGTPTIVTPEGVAGYDFLDEADTANALVHQLSAAGVDNIVVLLHEGGVTTGGGYNGCAGISGPIVDIVEPARRRGRRGLSGHTHQAYNCVIDGMPVTSAVVVRPPGHRHGPDDRPALQGDHVDLGRQRDRHPRRGAVEPITDADRPVQRHQRPAGATG